jgi:hypothetical protein
VEHARVEEAAEHFGRHAGTFMRLIDSDVAGHDFLVELQQQLAKLYSMAAELPQVSPSEEPLSEGMSNDESSALHRGLGRRLPFGPYWEMFEPVGPGKEPPAPVVGDLSDDLADIYRDLQEGFAQLSAADRIWSWRFNWEIHWGRHAIAALRAIAEALS